MNLHWADFLAIGVYFAVVIGIGFWSSCQNRGSAQGYFLARRSMNFIPIGASLFASNIGSGHFIGLAGSASASGIGVALFELTAIFTIVLLGWLFLPVYIRAGVSTMPEYIKKRFGGDRLQIYLSCLSLILYVFTKISADLFSGAIFIKLAVGLSLYAAIGILLFIAALFTIGGGASAVIWTDFIQTVFMIGGSSFLLIKGLIEIGGFGTLYNNYGYSIPSTVLFSNATCGIPKDDYFNLVRGIDSDLPWTGMFVGLFINSIWYWCTDQVIVQRVLAAKNLTHAKAGCIVAGYLKFLPLFLMVFPGMIGKILFRDTVGCSDPDECMALCNNPKDCSNYAYPTMVIELMPIGAKGLMLAVMMAALMSSLTSIFNSSSAIFTMDIWRRFRPKSKDWEQMIVGRVFVIVLVAISIAWIPIIEANQGSRLFDYIQAIQSFLAPPVCAIYILAIFTERTNEMGAFWGLIIGLVTGMIRFIWQFAYAEPGCGEPDTRPEAISKVHYLHFAIILFIVTIVSAYSISLLTKPIPLKYLKRLTYSTIYAEEEAVPIKNAKGKCCTFCVGADLNESDNEENDKKEQKDVKTEKIEKLKLKESKPYKKPNVLKISLFWICGIEGQLKKSEDDDEVVVEAPPPPVDTSIDENKFWSAVVDINVVIALALSGAAIAFLNKYS